MCFCRHWFTWTIWRLKSAKDNLDIPETIPSDFGIQRKHVINTPLFFDQINEGLRKAGLKIEGD